MAALTSLSWLDQARIYQSYGLSVMPLQPESKEPFPGFFWKAYQSRLAREEELEAWFKKYPEANLGIICGKVSGNLVVYDIDDRIYQAWMQPSLSLFGTLLVQTGTGKLHIYLRSQTKATSGSHNHLSHRLADVKGEGSYVVAPPSIHPEGGAYTVLQGSFEMIREVANARLSYDRLYAKYLKKDLRDKESAVYQDKSILPALEDEDLKELTARLDTVSLPPRVRQALTIPPRPGRGGWAGKSHSEIDFVVCAELIEAGLTDPQIEGIFASFPVGKACYQNLHRPNHGRGYLARTLDNARRQQDEHQTARAQSLGVNFSVLRVQRLELEEPQYELLIEARGVERVVVIPGADLFSRARTTTILGVALNFVPKYDPSLYSHEGWELFIGTVMALAEREDVPDTATPSGLLRQYIRDFLIRKDVLALREPGDLASLKKGWIDSAKHRVYIRPSEVILEISLVMRPSPGPEKVWQAFRFLNGQSVRVTLASGEAVELWEVPRESLS